MEHVAISYASMSANHSRGRLHTAVFKAEAKIRQGKMPFISK